MTRYNPGQEPQAFAANPAVIKKMETGITPWAWVVEQSLLASGSHDRLLSLRGAYEIPFIRRVADSLAPRCALVP